MQIFKCACGQEFADSEFRVSPDCDDCQSSTPNSLAQAIGQQTVWSTISYDPYPNNTNIAGMTWYQQNADNSFTITYNED